MKKYWIIGLASIPLVSAVALIISKLVYAGVTCSLPFNLQNNTVADANQVMANYNALVTCLTQAAHAGSNSDITALNALSTPIPPSSGGTNVWIGSNSTGINAQTTTTTPTGYALVAGYQVGFVVGTTNTASLTLNINATGVKDVYRRTSQGLVQTAGGEFISGNWVNVVYDGTRYQILGQFDNVGQVQDWAGSAGAAAPNGYFFADGSCKDRTLYATLFGVLGTTYNAPGTPCTGTQFQLPDLRGRATYAKDDQGGVAANRVTSGVSGCTGTALGSGGCGSQNATVAHTNLPQIPITDPGHFHTFAAGGNALQTVGAGSIAAAGAAFPSSAMNATQTQITVNATSTNVPLPVLNPMLVVYKIIKY